MSDFDCITDLGKSLGFSSQDLSSFVDKELQLKIQLQLIDELMNMDVEELLLVKEQIVKMKVRSPEPVSCDYVTQPKSLILPKLDLQDGSMCSRVCLKVEGELKCKDDLTSESNSHNHSFESNKCNNLTAKSNVVNVNHACSVLKSVSETSKPRKRKNRSRKCYACRSYGHELRSCEKFQGTDLKDEGNKNEMYEERMETSSDKGRMGFINVVSPPCQVENEIENTSHLDFEIGSYDMNVNIIEEPAEGWVWLNR